MTRIVLVLFVSACMTHLCWGTGLQSLTSRRAISAQDFKISLWNCLLLVNLIDISQHSWGSREVHLAPLQRCTVSADNTPSLCKNSVFSRVLFGLYFLPDGTLHCSDLFPSGNAELNQRGVHLEIPCPQHAHM